LSYIPYDLLGHIRMRPQLEIDSNLTSCFTVIPVDPESGNIYIRTALSLYNSLWNKQGAWDMITERVEETVPYYYENDDDENDDDDNDEMSGSDSHASPEPRVATFVNLEKIVESHDYPLLCLRFLVRNEYGELDKYLSDQTERRDVLLVGQPGIGMRIFASPILILKWFHQQEKQST
jgi:hypothetical protein